ncbi:MAG: hypothetical protein IJC66_05755 [Kiritimatiellae bacterium]|nr:hypothetical protein [Kiritimatiellia bacterium]
MGAESVVVVTRPVQLPGCFLLVWLLVWSPGVVLAAHHFLTVETIKSSGLLSGLPGWLQASIVMTMLLFIWCLALWGVLLSFFGKREIRLGAKWGECFTGVGRFGCKKRFRVEPGSKLLIEKRFVEYAERPSGTVYCLVLRNYVEKDLHLLDTFDLGECKDLQNALVENSDLEAVLFPPDYTEETPHFTFKGKIKALRNRQQIPKNRPRE